MSTIFLKKPTLFHIQKKNALGALTTNNHMTTQQALNHLAYTLGKIRKLASPVAKLGKRKEPWEMTFYKFYQDKSWDLKGEIVIDEVKQKVKGYKYSIEVPFNGKKQLFSVIKKGQVAQTAWEDLHKQIVSKALLEGKPVPAEVLAEYP